MKNVPHQINQIPRLTHALSVFRRLIEEERNIDDDGVVGDALARAGVYTFRERDRSIEELLDEEHLKPLGSQGSRTCARDLRRLFQLLGFLIPERSLSADANRLVELRSDPLGLEARAIWSNALDKMSLTDDSGTSHPYRILLRLVRELPGVRGLFLGLCLEARDDSESEFQRLKSLASRIDADAMWQELGVSQHMARNSVKILPSLARQLGDILEAEDGYHLGQPSVSESEHEPVEAEAARARNRRRRYDPTHQQERISSEGVEGQRRSVRVYDPDLVGERFAAHEACLRRFSGLIPHNHEQYEGDYDLLVVSATKALLVEVKTIREDEAKQIRLALGQILYYEHLLVKPMYPDYDVQLVVITDSRPHDDLIRLLEKYQIGAVWLPPANQAGQSELAAGCLNEFGIALR